MIEWRPSGERGALLSEDGVYRYALWRPVPEPYMTGEILWVMLNPSTADAERNDNTIRAIVRISRALGYPRLMVGNLYGFRARNPKVMKRAADPIGPENDTVLRILSARARTVVVAWGTHAVDPGRRADVLRILRAAHSTVHCLGTNAGGTPKHPLFLASATPLETFNQH
jgi:hypothetical protein